MNIAKLISPINLHNHALKNKKLAIDNCNTEQIHTPISIPNELPLHQRPYFKQSQFFKSNTQCDSDYTQPQRPKFKKIDSSLNEIEKLKSQFARRLKTQTYSQEKFMNRSNQRHLLKPSAAPKIGIATSEFTVACFGNQRNTIKEQTFSFQVEARSPKETQFNDDFQNHQPTTQYCNPSNFNQHCMSKPQTTCSCQGQFGTFIEKMRVKMQNITEKVKNIEQKNTNFKKRNQKVSKSKFINNQNSMKMKRHKTDYTEQQNQPILKQHYKKGDQSPNIQDSSKINKAKMQTLLQRLQLRIEKQ